MGVLEVNWCDLYARLNDSFIHLDPDLNPASCMYCGRLRLAIEVRCSTVRPHTSLPWYICHVRKHAHCRYGVAFKNGCRQTQKCVTQLSGTKATTMMLS